MVFGEDGQVTTPVKVITAIDYLILEQHPNGVDWKALAQALVRLKKGDVLDGAAVEDTKKQLSPFAKVQMQQISEPAGVRLQFVLEPYKRIEAININDAYPLFEKDVRTIMTVAVGDIFHPEDMPQQQKRIAQRYREEGYVDPQVQIQWDTDPDNGHYLLSVTIKKGAYYTLEKVLIRGNQAIDDDDLLSRMSTWRTGTFMFGTGRFVPKEFKTDVKNLIDYYRSERFAEVKITPELSFDPDHRRVHCDLVVQEGPQYTIALKGNKFYADFTLKREVEVFNSGNVANIGLRRTIQNIRRRYLAAGFSDVKVSWTEKMRERKGFQHKYVTIVIDEGKQYTVRKIIIKGNVFFDDEKLQRQMLTHTPEKLNRGVFVKDTLLEDITAITALYRMSGYSNVKITPTIETDLETAKVLITLSIEEGPQTKVRDIIIEGDTPISRHKLKHHLRLKPQSTFDPANLQADENQLAISISELGYPHVSVKADSSLSDDQQWVDIRYTIDPGPQVRVGEIFFLGNFKTRVRYMKRAVKFESGDPFVLKKVLDAQRDLRNLNVFDSVRLQPAGLKEKYSVVHLVVTVTERQPYYLELAGGYQTDKGLFGRFKVGDRNFLGMIKDLSTGLEVSQIGYRWDTSITDNHFLGTTISARAGLFKERSEPFNQDIGSEEGGSNVKFFRGWGQYFSTALATKYVHSQQYKRDSYEASENTESDEFKPRTYIVITPTLQYDARDSFIKPQKGEWVTLSVDYSYGLDNEADNFNKYSLDLRAYRLVIPRIVAAVRLWGGHIVPDTSTPPPQKQLFFLGGASTVRGFAENMVRFEKGDKAIGGLTAYLASMEVRIDIGAKFEVVPFVDTGSVQDAPTAVGENGFRWAAGLGLQYMTPIGPVGFFYGHKLDPLPKEAPGQWHLSIGYTF